MNDSDERKGAGPVEAGSWPAELTGYAWTSEARPRLHGYELYGDLARHYGFAELVLISLRGEAPTQAEGRLFETLLMLLAPCSVGEAPAHVAVLARTLRARWPALAASAASALAEQAESIVDQHLEFLDWLGAPTETLPTQARAQTDDEREATRLVALSVAPCGVPLPVIDEDPSPMALLLAAAYRCGLRDAEQLKPVLMVARLPAVLAEALRRPGDLRGYPMDTPHFAYVTDEDPST